MMCNDDSRVTRQELLGGGSIASNTSNSQVVYIYEFIFRCDAL